MKPAFCDFLPVPDLLKAETLLVVQPHPDDMEIGAGATLARLSGVGANITCLTITDGSVGTYDPNVSSIDLTKTRQKETEQSAGILGINDLVWLDFIDGGNLPYEEVRAKITRVIRQTRPDAILVCDPWLPYEVHSDHIRTGLAAAEAGFLAGMPHFCRADLEDGLEPHSVDIFAFYYTAYPNTFVDVSETWQFKMDAIDCHKSQFSKDQAEMFKTFLTLKSRHHAEGRGCELVEALKVLSPLHLHIFEEAWQC